jgi:tyrosine ammonia-lyase
MDFLSFEDIDLSEIIARIPKKGRDRMQFGIVELDLNGVVVAYNMGEAKISGRNAKDMIGKNFFTEIAPCTQSPEFYGRFKSGVAQGKLNARFDYLFDFEMDPTAVRVTMMLNEVDGQDRVMLLVRALPPDERDRAINDRVRLGEIESQRRLRGASTESRVAASGSDAILPAMQSLLQAANSLPNNSAELDLGAKPKTAPVVVPGPLSASGVKSVSKMTKPQTLDVTVVEQIALGRRGFELGSDMLDRAAAASMALDKIIDAGKPIYGITSGFGPLIGEPAAQNSEAHQKSLLHHLATGVGAFFSPVQTRAAMVARLQTLLQGYSGVSLRVIDLLKRMLDEGITPLVPQIGTVGASGDLTPLAHVALAMVGEGEVLLGRQRMAADAALTERRLSPLKLERRDALALVNGCSFSTGVAALNGAKAKRLLRWSVLSGAAYMQVLRAYDEPLSPLLSAVRPHLGQITVRDELSRLMRDNKLTRKEADDHEPPHQAYTLRCQPQLFGAILDAFDHHDSHVDTELNSVSDNPILDVLAPAAIHGGNFFGQHVAFASDYMRIAIVQLGQWHERVVARLVDPALHQRDDLPPQLRGGSTQSGLMGAQVTASAILAELKTKVLAASVQGCSTNANNQDIVPMATLSARINSECLELLAALQAISAIAVAQAIDLQLKPISEYSAAVRVFYKRVREIAPKLETDRSLSSEIQQLAGYLQYQDPNGEASIQLF